MVVVTFYSSTSHLSLSLSLTPTISIFLTCRQLTLISFHSTPSPRLPLVTCRLLLLLLLLLHLSCPLISYPHSFLTFPPSHLLSSPATPSSSYSTTVTVFHPTPDIPSFTTLSFDYPSTLPKVVTSRELLHLHSVSELTHGGIQPGIPHPE